MEATDNKRLVLDWLAAGPEGGRHMLADDFVWHTPLGTADLLNDGNPDFHGPDAPAHLMAVANAAYSDEENSTFDTQFCIAEGDIVVLQAKLRKTSFTGNDYSNYYVFCVRCSKGKIVELWEHADTKRWLDAVVPTPELRVELEQNIREQRAKV